MKDTTGSAKAHKESGGCNLIPLHTQLRAMSHNTQEAVEDWVSSLSQCELDTNLSQLELKRQGTLFRNQDRLCRWVLGIYAPQDFLESARPDDAIARRKRLREDLLRRLVTEEDGTFVQTTRWEVHPLEAVLGSDEIAQILLRTTVEAAREASETLLQSASQVQNPNATGTRQGTGDDNNVEEQQQQQQQQTN